MAVDDERDAGRVVAAVLQPAQPLDHDTLRLLFTDVAHNSAHGPESNGAPGPPPPIGPLTASDGAAPRWEAA